MTPPLPEGFTARLNHHARQYDGGRILVGGSPTRVLRLTDSARRLLHAETIEVRGPAGQVLADRLLDTGIADPALDSLPDIELGLLTVVVPVRDRPRQLDRLLNSIDPDIHVVVVDDASSAPQSIAATARRHGAEVILLPVNLGPAGARNHGLRRVTTPYVAFIDSDVVLEPGAVPTLLKHFHDPQVALAAPRIASLTQATGDGWISRYEHHRSSLDLGPHPGLVRPGARVAWLPGACMVARTSAIGNGFDPSMRVGEDVDLVWRLADDGWRLRYEPAAVVRHEHRSTLSSWLARKAYYGTGADLLAHRHHDHVAPAVFTPWSASFVLALLAQRRWSAPIAFTAAAATVVALHRKLPPSPSRLRISLTLTAHGALAACLQTSGLLLRHWWPAAVVGSLVSTRLRRALLASVLVDTVLEYRPRAGLDPVRFAIARRLDDLAYGAGVWHGALRGRSLRALKPVLNGRTPRQPGSLIRPVDG